jgi:hypothetical protein
VGGDVGVVAEVEAVRVDGGRRRYEAAVADLSGAGRGQLPLPFPLGGVLLVGGSFRKSHGQWSKSPSSDRMR